MDDANKEAVLARLQKNLWWSTPLTLCTVFGPPILFVWGYFGAERWTVWIPALSNLGAPLFVAMGLSIAMKITFWFCGIASNAFLDRKYSPWSNVALHWTGFTLTIILIVLQNALLAKIAPTFSAGYSALACVLSIVFNRPKWAHCSEISKDWVRQDQIRHAMYFAALFGAVATLNILIAFAFSTDSWVIFRFVAFLVTLVMSSGSVIVFRKAFQRQRQGVTP